MPLQRAASLELVMALNIRTHRLATPATESAARLSTSLYWISIAAIVSLAWAQLSFAQTSPEFHRTLTVTPAEMVALDIDLDSGELQLSYGRDGEVSIMALAKPSGNAGIVDSSSSFTLNVEQSGNHVKIRPSNDTDTEGRIAALYQIEVPYRTQLISKLNRGRQSITGILGPVEAVTNKGDIKAAYISNEVQARIGTGNLDLQVIGGRVDAVAGSGNISCTRVPEGVSAETGDGDITLAVVGPSKAIVKKGAGRIDVAGARDSLVGETDLGNIHVKAVPHKDWLLNSASGAIHIELPPAARVDLDVSTKTGELLIDREDIVRPVHNVQEFHQTINGGGRRIAVHTESGKIAIR